MNREIVVGYDGSTGADEALAWAARAARREHVPLRIVHVARSFLDGYVVADRPLDLTAQVGNQVLAGGSSDCERSTRTSRSRPSWSPRTASLPFSPRRRGAPVCSSWVPVVAAASQDCCSGPSA